MASAGPISGTGSSSNGTSSGAPYSNTFEGHPSGSDVSGGQYDDSLTRLMGGWSSLVPGWSLGDTTQGIRNWLSATPAELLAQGWEDAHPYENGFAGDAGPGSSHSGTQASLSEHFSDAVAQAGAVTEDLWWLPGSAAFVAMAEIARRKALADRKTAMAAEGMTPIDNAADPRAMTFASADGSKTVEYTLSNAACFSGVGQKYCKYITTELITEHKVGDTMEYEYTTREVTNSYHLTYDPEKGFSPVTFEDSISNSASLDEGWNAVAESGAGQSAQIRGKFGGHFTQFVFRSIRMGMVSPEFPEFRLPGLRPKRGASSWPWPRRMATEVLRIPGRISMPHTSPSSYIIPGTGRPRMSRF